MSEGEASSAAAVAAGLSPAAAKVNLTLRVLGRRPDGYHEIDSLVAFASVGDELTLTPADTLSLHVAGETAAAAGATDSNLVMTAARALARRHPGLRLGRFALIKRLPVAAGLGGGSADAAAALRLLARLNGLAPDDAGVMAVARETGADVPVCLASRARRMGGVGERLSPVLTLPPLHAVLVNPGVALATAEVFRALAAGPLREGDHGPSGHDPVAAAEAMDRDALFARLAAEPNDLEVPALALRPVIGTVLAALRDAGGCRLARMSGSGATCFGLFDTADAASAAAADLAQLQPAWWVRGCTLS